MIDAEELKVNNYVLFLGKPAKVTLIEKVNSEEWKIRTDADGQPHDESWFYPVHLTPDIIKAQEDFNPEYYDCNSYNNDEGYEVYILGLGRFKIMLQTQEPFEQGMGFNVFFESNVMMGFDDWNFSIDSVHELQNISAVILNPFEIKL